MRQITQNAVNAMLSNRSFNGSNTNVIFKAIRNDGTLPKGDHFLVMELFGNEIAAIDSKDNQLYITNAGWKSNTAKERLNALPNVSIQQINGIWYLNGTEWNGEWIAIK